MENYVEAVKFEKMKIGEVQILDFGSDIFKIRKMTKSGFLVYYLNNRTNKLNRRAMSIDDLNRLFNKVE